MLYDDRVTKRSLPIRVPCPKGERWQDMAQETGGRRCLRCDDHIVDLSALTEAQAQDFRRRMRGKQVCAVVSVDSEGTPIYQRRAVRRLVQTAAGVVMSVSLAACGGEGDGVTVTQLEPATAAHAEPEIVAEPKPEPTMEWDHEPKPDGDCAATAETGSATADDSAPHRRVRRRGPRTDPSERLILGYMD